jgi:hypothetical protein
MSEINPDLKIVGLTATPFRLDSGRLDEGDVRMFDGIAYEAQISDLIEQGYLSPLVTKATQTVLDVSRVHKLGGEFKVHELQLAVNVHEGHPGGGVGDRRLRGDAASPGWCSARASSTPTPSPMRCAAVA